MMLDRVEFGAQPLVKVVVAMAYSNTGLTDMQPEAKAGAIHCKSGFDNLLQKWVECHLNLVITQIEV